MRTRLLVFSLTLALSGCYHATVNTGMRPGMRTVENKWASSFILGLVPPSTVETMDRCPQGVARVETQLSFLNQVVSWITFGIYTPMEILVTCAEGEENDAPEATSSEEASRLLKSGEAFLLRLD
jgi:hypothetical protein